MVTCQGPKMMVAQQYPEWWAQLQQTMDAALGEATPRVGQLEIAPTTGKAHGQVTFTLADKRTVGALHKLLTKAATERELACGFFLEARKGTEAEAAAYCSKEESAWKDPVTGDKLITWRVWKSVSDCSDG